jgi:hypothetical protein
MGPVERLRECLAVVAQRAEVTCGKFVIGFRLQELRVNRGEPSRVWVTTNERRHSAHCSIAVTGETANGSTTFSMWQQLLAVATR